MLKTGVDLSIDYFEHETIDIKTKDIDDTPRLSDEEINEKYANGEIRIITEQGRYQVNTISGMIKDNIKIQPEYQRRLRWDNGKKSRLIESFIMNVPIPPVFFYEVAYSSYEVMDGLQRLTAISDFYEDKFALEGLEYWRDLEGRRYSTLPENIKKGIDRRYLSSVILLQETAKTPEEASFMKQVVFERLNSGGEKLTPQETRNALYDGGFNRLCIELSRNPDFVYLWKLPMEADWKKLNENQTYNKMLDVELVLRFFAYRHMNQLSTSIEKFLDLFLQAANKFSTQTLDDLKKLFSETIKLARDLLGEGAFTIPYKKSYLPVKTIYDPLMQSLSKFIKYKGKIVR